MKSFTIDAVQVVGARATFKMMIVSAVTAVDVGAVTTVGIVVKFKTTKTLFNIQDLLLLYKFRFNDTMVHVNPFC